MSIRDGLEFLVYRFDPASVLSVCIAFRLINT
jgi:hypothetical protein